MYYTILLQNNPWSLLLLFQTTWNPCTFRYSCLNDTVLVHWYSLVFICFLLYSNHLCSFISYLLLLLFLLYSLFMRLLFLFLVLDYLFLPVLVPIGPELLFLLLFLKLLKIVWLLILFISFWSLFCGNFSYFCCYLWYSKQSILQQICAFYLFFSASISLKQICCKIDCLEYHK